MVKKHLITAVGKETTFEKVAKWIEDNLGHIEAFSKCDKCESHEHYHAAVDVTKQVNRKDYDDVRQKWCTELVTYGPVCDDCVKATTNRYKCKLHKSYLHLINIQSEAHWQSVIDYIENHSDVSYERYRMDTKNSKRRKDGSVSGASATSAIESLFGKWGDYIIEISKYINGNELIDMSQLVEMAKQDEYRTKLLVDPLKLANVQKFNSACAELFQRNKDNIDASYGSFVQRFKYDEDNDTHRACIGIFKTILLNCEYAVTTTCASGTVTGKYHKVNNDNMDKLINRLFSILLLKDEKKTTIVMHGKSNTGKTLLSNALTSMYENYEKGSCLLNQSVSRDNFWSQDLLGKFIYQIEECCITSPSDINAMKLLFEGNQVMNINVKYKNKQELKRRPLIVTFNGDAIADMLDGNQEYLKDFGPVFNRSIILRLNKPITSYLKKGVIRLFATYFKYAIPYFIDKCVDESLNEDISEDIKMFAAMTPRKRKANDPIDTDFLPLKIIRQVSRPESLMSGDSTSSSKLNFKRSLVKTLVSLSTEQQDLIRETYE